MILQINPTFLSSSTFVGRSHVLCAVGHWMWKRPPPEPDLDGVATAVAAISISIGMIQSGRGTSTTSSDTTMSDTSRNQTFKKDALLNKKIHKNRLLSSSAVSTLVSLLGCVLIVGYMSMRTVQSSELQATQMKAWYHYCLSSFLAVMIMTMLASLSSFSSPRSRIAEAAVDLNGKLSPTYAQSFLHSILMDVLKIVLPFSKLNHNGDISQTRAKKKEARSKRTPRAYLLALLVVFCLVDGGEASWFGPPRRSLIDVAKEEAVDTVNVEEMQVTMYTYPNSEVVEDDSIGGGEVKSNGLEPSESPKLNRMQMILISARRMGGISGPLLIQSSILFDDDTSMNKGGLVDDGVESEITNSSSKLVSPPTSRAVIVRDGDPGLLIHFTVDEDESAHVSKREVSNDVLPEPKIVDLNRKADDDGVSSSVQDTTVDVLSDTSTKALEETKGMSRKSDWFSFLVAFAVLIFVMILTAVSCGVLSSTYARALYDRGCKNLRVVLKSAPNLYPMSNHSGGKSRCKSRGKGRGHGKSRSKAKQKAAPSQLKCFRSLLVLMVITGVFCILGSGEAVLFSHNNDGEAAEGVNGVLDDGVVEGVSIEIDSVSVNSPGQDAAAQVVIASNNINQGLLDPVNDGIESDIARLQEYASTSGLASVQKEMAEVYSSVQLVTSDEASSDQDVLKAASNAISLVKDRMVDLQLSASMPSHLQSVVKNTLNQLTNAEKHMQNVDHLASQYGGLDGLAEANLEKASKRPTNSRKLLLRNQGGSSAKYHFNSGVSKADYHHRAKSHHQGQGQGFHPFLGNQFGQYAGHQQGYRGARVLREEGQTTHRRLQDDTNVCLPASRDVRKAEQCFRLANCANNYGLYDMFAFFFADDFNFETGVVDDKIQVHDERKLREKLDTINTDSGYILNQYNDDGMLTDTDTTILEIGGECDQLLQQFHRFDEGIGLDGKWAGGSVTGVCRGWGSTKFVSLESIYDITSKNLNGKAQVELCLENEVAAFNAGSRDNGDSLLSTPSSWCTGSHLFTITSSEGIDTSYCAENSQITLPCSPEFNSCSNCECTQEEVAASIEDSGAICQSSTDSGCKIDPRIVIFAVPTGNICEQELNVDNLFQDATTKNQAQADINAAFKCLYYSALENSYTGAEYDCVEDGVTNTCTYPLSCDNLFTQAKQDECNKACNGRNDPIFEVRNTAKSEGLFQYRVPTSLPPLEKRLGRDSTTGQLTGEESLGAFLPFDIALTATDEIAAEFTVEVFEEFMTCATKLVTALAPNNKIFSNNGGTNPYAPDDNNQFYLPLDILGAATDDHGQILGEYLNQLFDYTSFGGSNGIEVCGSNQDCKEGSLVFSTALRELFIEAFVYKSLTEQVEVYQECVDDTFTEQLNFLGDNPAGNLGLCEGDCDNDDQCIGDYKCFQREGGPAPPGCGGTVEKEWADYCYDPFCENQLDRLENIRGELSDQGLISSTFFDESIALLLGNGTTIGQTCSYSRGLELETVGDIPGFCCLDAPYEAQDWGETYACQKHMPNERVDALPGSSIVVQKGPADCNNLGPVTAGFNQAACDIFYGQWCPNPQDCSVLALCIQDEIVEIEKKQNRPAFLQYLKDAPPVNVIEGEGSDPTKCGDLREYFEYDRDYADDDRICEEVKDLKCLTDFSNLDGLVTGVPGANDDVNADVQLAVSNVIQAPIDTAAGSDSVNSCSSDTSQTIRSSILGFQKTVQVVSKSLDLIEDAKEKCDLIPCVPIPFAGCTDFGEKVCKIPIEIAKSIVRASLFVTEISLDVLDRVYGTCTPADDVWESSYQLARQDATYNNAITNGRNIITTFYATQQLKIMLGEISDGLEADREERDNQRRRRLQSVPCTYTEELDLSDCTCVDTSRGFSPAPCGVISCQDENRLCDGSYNYPLISELVTAGCDDMDSDGDREADVCEDRFPPNILARDAKIFRCDRDDTSKLCYTDKWFKNATDVFNFLEYEFPAADDCAPSTKLSVTIDYERGECQNTVYRLEPFQDYPECNDLDDAKIGPFNLTFQNPLNGTAREVTVQLDEVAPVVECGFLVPNTNSANMVDGKTLYHYLLKTDGGGRRLNDARLKNAGFFYNVTENCDADVHVDVVVESNELQQNTVSQLFKRKRVGFVEQAEFLYAPTHCDCEKKVDGLCKTDPSMGDLKTRYYDITVTASDSAGNTGSDTCRVVIVPSCDDPETDPDTCKEYDGPELPNVEDFYYSRAAVYASITQSQVLNQVAQQKLTWEDGLAALDPEEETNEAVDVDVDPPVLTCKLNTQGLSGTGAGVFTDLGFTFTAVDGGKKCTKRNSKCSKWKRRCKSSKDLAVSIEVLSNEVVATGEEIVIISDSRVDGVPSIWAEDHTCMSSKNGKCKVSSPEKLREYVVRVTATDESGISATVQCNTIIGGEQDDTAAVAVGEQDDTAVGDPLFLIAKVDIVGGVEPNEASSNLFLGRELTDVEKGEPGGEEAPWVTDEATNSPSESSRPSLRPSSLLSSMPSSCVKQGEAPPNNDCSLCCSDRGCNKERTCRRE